MSAESAKVIGRRWGIVVLWAMLLGAAPAAWGYDDFLRTEAAVPTLPSTSMLSAEQACNFGHLGQPLSLQEAIERALCRNPKTREAWASVKMQAAGVGVAQAAYLPTLSASWQALRDHSTTSVVDQPELSSHEVATQRTQSLSLSWVLYDFGGRGAALDNATALFAAA